MNFTYNRVVVVGGGAAGFFTAIVLADLKKDVEVIILEKTMQPLAKVKISGGGRCNVTHDCYDPQTLSMNYPRGSDVLRKAFYTFQPKDMIQWLQDRGVEIKIEHDGRIFPKSNTSSTIIECFLKQAKDLNVKVQLHSEVQQLQKLEDGWRVQTKDQGSIDCDYLVLATGGLKKSYELFTQLGHTLIEPVPSLFTFNIKDERLDDLSGVSVSNAKLSIEGASFSSQGPLLITHWGVSGPGVLRLSAFAARYLHDSDYDATLCVNWAPQYAEHEVRESLLSLKKENSAKPIAYTPAFGIPKNLWKKLLEFCHIFEDKLWAHLSKQELHQLVQVIVKSQFKIQGKSTNKDEFVTCGGVSWKEVDHKTMESKVCKGLFFVGEVLDSDGVTGGFNFQNAWTTAWIAAHAIGDS
ncbi:MAG: NAD(P)/FAD-dependent oxidoreductase [Chlamydiae bacterium]|nr:NAD(P)/FAD-dependent oxidoreductase [Chlamydiota bacterium]